MLDLRLCIKSLFSSEVVSAMMTFSEFGFFKKSVKFFLVGGIFFSRFSPIDVKKLLKFCAILVGSVIVLSSAIMANILHPFFSGGYYLMYTLPYCFGIFFVLLKITLIVSLFILPY